MKRDKKWLIGFIGICVFFTFLPSLGFTQVPMKMNYQGYLTDAGGTPVHGTVSMVFSIYDSSMGGTALWSETQNVAVNQGFYSVNLGDMNPVNLAFDKPYYLGVKVGADPEMTARSPLTSVGYAFRAQSVDSVGSHTHSGNDITSGTISQACIDATITRDSEVMTIVKTNGGTGSGLDADLLDGQHATYFAASSHTHTGVYAPVSHNHSANNIDSGTLSTDRFSAYSDLTAEGYLDNSTDGDILTRSQADGRFVNVTGDTMSATSSGAVLSATNSGTGDGVYGSTSGTSGRGVNGYATSGVGVEGINGTNNNTGKLGTSEAGGFFSGGTDHNDIILGGSVGRINTDPAYPDSDLYLSSNNDVIVKLDNDGGENGVFRIKNSGGSDVVTVDETGNTIITGNVTVNQWGSASATPVCRNGNTLSTCSSSTRYKEQIQDLNMGMQTVERLRPVSFKWRDREEYDLGLIAEEVEEIDPLLVNYNNKGEVEGVKYMQLAVILINAVKELKAENDDLRRRISEMEGRITYVER